MSTLVLKPLTNPERRLLYKVVPWLDDYQCRPAFLPFEEARKFVHKLKLKSTEEWRKYIESKQKPAGIPSTPYKVYQRQWLGMADWLGYERTPHRHVGEWVKIAESLAKKHKGILPSPRWLCTHGLSGLQVALLKHPQSFDHIQKKHRSQVVKTLEDWVEVARDLARKNGGQLPPILHIKEKLKLHGLVSAIQRFPEKFRGIKREFILRRPEHWIKPAKQLIRKHGGKLPGPGWLRDNGYTWLNMALKNHPELYRELGVQRPEKIVWRSFEKARAFVRTLGLETESDFRRYCKSRKKPDDIPTTPGRTYAKVWLGMSDWLGYNSRRKTRLS